MDVQRNGSRTVDQGRRRRSRARRASTTSCRMSTGVHWHGIEVPFAMDGVPDVTQKPVKPGKKFTYDFVAKGPAARRCTTRTTTREVQVPERHARHLPSRRRRAARPNTGPVDPRSPDGAERRRRDRPLAQRQVVPGDRAGDRASRATGSRSTTSTRACRSTRCTCTGCRNS